MSVRRAAFLNLSPWLGLIVLVPVVNLVVMLILAYWPDPSDKILNKDSSQLLVRENYKDFSATMTL